MLHPLAIVRSFNKAAEIRRDVRRAREREFDVSFFHEFVPPPAGGGHQFMRALWAELERRGLRVEGNTISATTWACLFNSFNFDAARLKAFRRPGCRMVHRVDGPIGVYRGFDDGTDRRIWEINRDLADVSVFQSRYSLQKHVELGFTFAAPRVIMNATNPAIFHPEGRLPFDPARKIRLISASWSDNTNKGAETYRWLDRHLDWNRYEYVFVGRLPVTTEHIRVVAPIGSEALAEHLRQSDIFITASRNDPCSNSLIEALACGLPALYLDSGGHPEIAGEAGFAFQDSADIPDLLSRLIAEYPQRQALIRLPTLTETADRYLRVLRGDAD